MRRLKAAAESPARWGRIFFGSAAGRAKPYVYYGRNRVPGADGAARGGLVKLQRLQQSFPNAPRDFNIVYLGSGTAPRDLRQLLWLSRRRHAPVVWNQNGVGYPAWAGARTARINRPLALGLHSADHVFYQSEFCKLSADRFLGVRDGPGDVLYNCVDTRVFAPSGSRPQGRPLTLLVAGSHESPYRIDVALRALQAIPDARLVVAGHTRSNVFVAADKLGLGDRVEFVGAYTQAEAPELYRSADLLLHTQYNDASPGLVVEAMACGLPVVYSASGGTPEIVGNEAGAGVPAPLDWDLLHPPDPEALADAVVRVAARLDEYREAARRRAVERFDIAPWIERHAEVFRALLG